MNLHVEWISPTEVALIDVAHPEYRHRFTNMYVGEFGIEADHSVEKSTTVNIDGIPDDEEDEFLEKHLQTVWDAFMELSDKLK